MKIAIIYSSIHHGNTKKLVEGISKEVNVELIETQKVANTDLSQFDMIGLASGIYNGSCHQQIINFIEKNKGLDLKKKTFLMLTCGAVNKKYGLKEKEMLEARGCEVLDIYICKGYDTYGIFKLFGGIAKGHPNNEDIKEAAHFVKALATRN